MKKPASLEPYLASKGDPAYTKPKVSHRGKSIKVLTKRKKWRIIQVVKKLKRKDDKMAKDKIKNNKKTKATGMLKSIAWLLFGAQQALCGLVLLKNFDNYFVVASALVSLFIAGGVVVYHFVGAHVK